MLRRDLLLGVTTNEREKGNRGEREEGRGGWKGALHGRT